MISDNKLVLDTSFIIKGIIPPKVSTDHADYQKKQKLFFTANKIISQIFVGHISSIIPSMVLIEVSAVSSRITNNTQFGLDLVDKLRTYCEIIYEEDLLEQAIEIGAHTRTGGVDTLLITTAKVAKAPLITDDIFLHDICHKQKVRSYLLSKLQDR